MKKALTYFWLAFYTMLSFGIQVNLHYCSDQLKAVGLWEIEDCCHQVAEKSCCHAQTECKHAEDAPKKDCCSDETVEIGLEDEHLTARAWSTDSSEDSFILPFQKKNATVWTSATTPVDIAPKTGPPPRFALFKRFARFQQRLTYG